MTDEEAKAVLGEAQYIDEYHADTRLIGAQMQDLNIPTVLLTHLIPPPDTPEAKSGFVDDLRNSGYDGRIVVCDDLDSVTLNKGELV